jgi:exodeoxyribonuclease VIII
MATAFKDENYHDDRTRVSSSMLSVLKKSSTAFYRQFIADGGKPEEKETPQMRLGTLVHSLVLEPHLFEDQYIVLPDGDYRTKAFQAFKTDAESQVLASKAAGVNLSIIYQHELDTAKIMAHRLRQHDVFGRCYTMLPTWRVEEKIEFEWLGVQCKAKPDAFADSFIFDIKTTADPSPDAFARQIFDRGYHRQAAFYRIAVNELLGVKPTFFFVTVQNCEPYDVAMHDLDDESLELGREEVEALLREYKRRLETGNWIPEWGSGVNPIEKPKYYDPKIYAEGGKA